jgi:hypothetical protein
MTGHTPWMLCLGKVRGVQEALLTCMTAASATSNGRQHVTKYILEHAGSEIRKLRLLRPIRVPCESAFLEHVPGGSMLGVAESVEPPHPDLASHVDHRPQSLGGITVAPRVLRQHVAGDGLAGFLEGETSPSEEPPVATGRDEIRAGRPLDPLIRAEPHEGLCLGNRLMPRPTQKSCDFRIAGVASEDRLGIGDRGWPQNEPTRDYFGRCFHCKTKRATAASPATVALSSPKGLRYSPTSSLPKASSGSTRYSISRSSSSSSGDGGGGGGGSSCGMRTCR